VLVFDAFLTPQAAADLRKAAEEITGNPVRYLVNSHWHGDHVRGNQAFADVSIIATEITRNLMREHLPARIEGMRTQGPAYLKSLEEQLANAQDETERQNLQNTLLHVREVASTLDTLTITLPTVTFERKLTLHGTRRTAELITLGGGHSPSDIFLCLPQDKIMFMGDLLFVKNHLAFWNANEQEWKEILEQVAQFDAEQFVPGHGPLGTKEDVLLNIQYLTDLLNIVQDYIKQGGTEEGLSELKAPPAYDSWDFGTLFADNVKKLFKERSQN
jgi:cyclase